MIWIRAAHQLEERRARPVLDRGRRDDHLREDVERVLHDACRLDVAIVHSAHDGEHLHAVVAERRDEDAATRRRQRMARASDPLQPRGHALRRLEL